MLQREFIHPSEVAILEDCHERTAIRRLRRIKRVGKVTLDEYAKSRNVSIDWLRSKILK